ncbi:bifunctional nuclease family protein [bacterium]|nr:bifunctional nuclease family protein [bacterium]MBU1025637.1 bifunctional nuclease family protein [bacterium]
MKEMLIHAIMFDMFAKSPVVILKEARGNRYLPILVGVFEASAIDIGLKKKSFARPMTHDLLSTVINLTEFTIDHIEINQIKNRTFFANISLYSEGKSLIIDSRPSDAIALAVRCQSPILVHEEILIDAGVEFPEPPGEGEEGSGERLYTTTDDSHKFKDFISRINPEDILEMDVSDDLEQLDDIEEDDDDEPPFQND